MLDIKIRPYISSDYNYICDIHDAARKMELSLASLDVAFLPFSLAAEREKSVILWQRKNIMTDAELAEALNGHSICISFRQDRERERCE